MPPVLRSALFALAVLAGPSLEAAQDRPFRSTASIVALNVTVQDAQARYIKGLQSSDFAVFEDGVRQDVRFFYATALPLDLVLLLDTSRSMRQTMPIAEEAARGLLSTLAADDRAAVLGFAERVTIVQDLTGDRTALAAAAPMRTHASGYTALRNAVYTALGLFESRSAGGAPRRQAIVVLSDGIDTSSVVGFDDVLARARQAAVSVYTVRLRAPGEQFSRAAQFFPERFSESDYEMKTLAQETGALSFFPQAADLPRVYGAIAEELAMQYAVGYEPSDGTRAGFRRVSVQIIGRSDLRARTRTGYTPSAGGRFRR